ncbi:hypothetical protein ACOSQ3_026162 [Xanthoceras sorbifolium]
MRRSGMFDFVGPIFFFFHRVKLFEILSSLTAAASPHCLTHLPLSPPGHHPLSAASPSQPPASFGAAQPVVLASRVPRRSLLRGLSSSPPVSSSGFPCRWSSRLSSHWFEVFF